MKNKKLKVVDFSTLIPGPMISSILASELGAMVIKFEDKTYGDRFADLKPTKEGVGIGYRILNRDKKVVSVDWEIDLERMKKEIEDADVLVENFRPGKAEALGIGYDEVLKINPSIIYVSVLGYKFGHKWFGKAAHDINILAVSGYLDIESRYSGQTVMPQLQVADILSGYVMATKVMATLINKTGAKHLRISMMESVAEALNFGILPFALLSRPVTLGELFLSGQYPCYRLYESKDKRTVAVAALERSRWVDFCDHIKEPNWKDRQFDSRLPDELGVVMKRYNFKHWLDADLDLCVTPVLTAAEAIKYGFIETEKI